MVWFAGVLLKPLLTNIIIINPNPIEGRSGELWIEEDDLIK